MEKTKKPRRVRMTISLTKEAQDIIFDHGYASPRTVGTFLSELVVEHHMRRTQKPTAATIAAELRALADRLDQA